jgi:hypothetical protein
VAASSGRPSCAYEPSRALALAAEARAVVGR